MVAKRPHTLGLHPMWILIPPFTFLCLPMVSGWLMTTTKTLVVWLKWVCSCWWDCMDYTIWHCGEGWRHVGSWTRKNSVHRYIWISIQKPNLLTYMVHYIYVGEKIPWGNGKLVDNNTNTATNASTTSSTASSATASPASGPPAATSGDDTGVTPNAAAAAADTSHHPESSVTKHDPSLWWITTTLFSSAVVALHSVYQ